MNDQRFRLPGGRRVRAGGQLRAWLTLAAAAIVGSVLLAFGLVLAVAVLVVGLVVGVIAYGVLRWKLRRWRKDLAQSASARYASPPAGRGAIIDVQARPLDDEPRR